MKTSLEFNPQDYSPAVLQMIMAFAEEWKCTPSEALSRLLDDLAAGKVKKAA